MRLLNTKSLELSRPYVPSEVPDYAILSHRWNTEEVTFADISNACILQPESQVRTKNGFAKIQGACERALSDGYAWIWIDSCCIDKSSSAELQEAINSMWRYYAESNICYVYLADVPDSEAGWGPMFTRSEWFTRGWTLQELIAPTFLEFFAENWVPIGTKFERYQQIAEISLLDPDVLIRVQVVDNFSAAERFSWASHRNVTREEDEAYSLLGLFDVNMPLLYGEGREKAFVRLQEAIYNATADQSMFLFRHSQYKHTQPLLANSPTGFCDRLGCIPCGSRAIRNISSSFRYREIIASERWTTQAHEQIMTTVTTSRNEMSTMFPLLTYQDVSDRLEFFDKKTLKVNVTHVAVLNHTLEKYPEGAFCLLLSREPDLDSSLRLQVLPAVLSRLGDLVSRLQQTKLLICPGPRMIENENLVETVFLVDSKLFRVEAWGTEGSNSQSLLSAPPRRNTDFKMKIRESGTTKSSVRVFFRMFGSQSPKGLLTIHLTQIHGIWSIKEIFEPRNLTTGRKLRTLFLSKIPTDRCVIEFPSGKMLSVKLRRLPSSARTPGGYIVRNRYQISIDSR